MGHLVAERSSCQGYGNCVVTAPDAFDIDDDGVVVVLRSQVSAADRDRLTEAVHQCPMSALSIVEEP